MGLTLLLPMDINMEPLDKNKAALDVNERTH